MPALTKALQDYTLDTQLLLRDTSFQTYTQQTLSSFINKAIEQRDLDLQINRVKYSFPMIAGQFTYAMATIQGSGTLLLGAANQTLIDLRTVIVVPIGSQQAGIRYPLMRWPYSRVAYLLSTSYPTYPVIYANFGGRGDVIVAPPPANPYPTEWDFITASPVLISLSDTDPMPYPFTEPVPYFAAYLCKLQNQRFDEAKAFREEYSWHLRRVMGGARPMAVTNPWADLPRGAR